MIGGAQFGEEVLIYILLTNGASVVPFFLPGLPQLLLLLATLRVLFICHLLESLPIFFVLIALSFLVIFAGFESLSDQTTRFFKLIINALVAYAFAGGLVYRYGPKFPQYYSHAVFFFTAIGILGTILTLFTDWNITFVLGVREYHTNLLTTWLTDGGFNSSQTFVSPFPYRLQALFDEPGTFGILLVPAFFHCVKEGKFKESSILLIGAFLSESANAWVLCLIILLSKVWLLNSKDKKILLLLVLAVLLVFAAPTLVKLYEIKAGIDEAYANSSSLGTRSQEYAYLLQNWDRHLLPFQNLHVIAEFPDGISVSYVSWYIYGGVIFVAMTLIVALKILMILLRRSNPKDPADQFRFVLGSVLLLSGAQRSSLFDNVLFMTLAFWALLYRPRRPREIYAAATRY